MKSSKILSRTIIVFAALAMIIAIYLALTPKVNNNEDLGNITTAPDLSISSGSESLRSATSDPAASSSAPSNTPLPSSTPIPKDIIFYQLDNGQSQKVFTRKADKKYTVFSMLQDISQNDKIELKYNNKFKFGVLIDSIDGIESGTDNKWWQYYINGELGPVAADKQELKGGDKVEWRFEKVP